MLKNKKFIGTYTFLGEENLNKIPRIIEDKLFDEVQSMLKERENAPGKAKSKTDYILTSKLFCGHCEALMTSFVGNSKTKRTYNYYKCNNARGAKKTCHKKGISKDLIEDYVISEIRKILTTDNINIIAKKLLEYIEKTSDNTEIKNLNKLLKKNRVQYNNLLNSIKNCPNDNIKKSLFNEMEKLDNQYSDLETELLFEEANTVKITPQKIKVFLNELKNGNVNDLRYKKMLVNTLIYKIYLFDDDRIMFIFTSQEEKYETKLPNKNELLSSFKGTSAPP